MKLETTALILKDDVRRLAVRLYQKFWARNGWENPTPFSEQAPAIQEMWMGIARDAQIEMEALSRGR